MNAANTEKIMKVRAHVTITGSVQGVFFRLETRRVANAYGVTGWIQNLPDGRVEAVFEGEEENVKRLVEFCRKGPPPATVDNVDVCWERFSGRFSGFEIRHA
jgi:acylphosphatase